MNKEQVAILAAFDAAMQTLVEVFEDPSVSDTQLAAAYGAASFMLILAKRTTDIKDKASHAAKLLNDAARDLGMPETN